MGSGRLHPIRAGLIPRPAVNPGSRELARNPQFVCRVLTTLPERRCTQSFLSQSLLSRWRAEPLYQPRAGILRPPPWERGGRPLIAEWGSGDHSVQLPGLTVGKLRPRREKHQGSQKSRTQVPRFCLPGQRLCAQGVQPCDPSGLPGCLFGGPEARRGAEGGAAETMGAERRRCWPRIVPSQTKGSLQAARARTA